jgi:hypothetical protein
MKFKHETGCFKILSGEIMKRRIAFGTILFNKKASHFQQEAFLFMQK